MQAYFRFDVLTTRSVVSVSCVKCMLFMFPGPAGTGKTESVKALGNQLGRFVLVFNCDETFDFQVTHNTQKFSYLNGFINVESLWLFHRIE